jgi:Uma2 family endonuclease
MTSLVRWTSADLESLPDDENRYEIIDGELFVSKQPHLYHQIACSELDRLLGNWNDQGRPGVVAAAPGLIFADDDDVAPDLIWISKTRLATALGPDGKLHAAPELVVEVLSPGASNEKRDREAKLTLYSRRGVDEYWIIDWRARSIDIYRRQKEQLHFIETLSDHDILDTPLLPGFSAPVTSVFIEIP